MKNTNVECLQNIVTELLTLKKIRPRQSTAGLMFTSSQIELSDHPAGLVLTTDQNVESPSYFC